LRWLGHLFRMETPGKTQDTEGLCLSLAWEHLGVPPDELEEVCEREVWESLLRLLPPRPGNG